ncbi:MAG: TolC family protein, partial [Elusimicrobiaceae bacterium]|nr:TolC family protein [Elusimicrobiaceae bacterium]
MKKQIGLFLCLLSALPAIAQSNYGLDFSDLLNENLTLQSAIRIGLENNTEFLSAKEEITIAEQKVSEAKFRYLPQFALQGTATWYEADSPMVLPEAGINRFLPDTNTLDAKHFYGVGVTATQYLYSGGRINSTLKTARANLKQVQSRY